jgi:hypothetical protein
MGEMAHSIEEMGEKIAAPKKIIRENGKIVGSETIGA